MLPARLTIEGLYSYQDRQVIDFSNLTRAGLFGIFGAVGSGKSSILEAISYVLYGETERLHARDRRTYNMMNLQSNRAYIELEFYNHEDQLFLATLELKRNSKRFEDVYSPARVFYADKGGKWEPLDHTDAEKLIGLSYANFKRTIIVPQGQFKEFLELGDKDRTQMMKEIFQLHRFDMQDKAASLRKQNTSQTDQLEGQLKAYETISKEALKEIQTLLTGAIQNHNQKKKAFDQVNETYQQWKHLKNDADQLEAKRQNFEMLKGEEADIKAAEQRLNEYENILKIFGQILIDTDKIKKLQEDNIREKNAIEIKLNHQQRKLRDKETTLQKIRPYVDILSQKRTEENDLQLIVQAAILADEIKWLEARMQKGKAIVLKTEADEKSIQSEIEVNEKIIPEKMSRKLDSALIINVGNWYMQQENLKESIKNQETRIETEKKKNKQVADEMKAANIHPENFKEELTKLLESLKTNRETLEKQKGQLDLQRQLSQYQDALHKGKPCPLCGSEEHPQIIKIKDVEDDLKQIIAEIKGIDRAREDALKQDANATRLLEKKILFQQNILHEEVRLQELKNRTEEHLAAFIWHDFDPEDPQSFNQKKDESAAIEIELTELNRSLDLLRKQKESKRNDLKKYQETLEELKQNEAASKGKRDSLINNLRILSYEDYQLKKKQEIEAILEKLKQKNDEVDHQNQTLNTEINQLKTNLAADQSTFDFLAKREAEIQTDKTLLENRLQQNLSEQRITNIETVRGILSQNIEVLSERNRIRAFEIKFETLKSSIGELEKKLAQFSYSTDKYAELETQWQAAESTLKSANQTLIQYQTEAGQMTKRLEEKKTLLQRYDELKKRGENLQILFNLFKGAGFVEYISSIFLQQLCDQANVRFHRMTRNQLSLQLGANNDFEIIDYLNEGRSRSVKTLSGGQSFQVSLSLALALAESVQANAKATKNFFFIDEGFGTQDADSINVIFETLVNLNRENKIVGIISHVEDLKDRIPQALTIIKDTEKGSRIYYPY